MSKSLTVNLVLDEQNRGWIIEKMAHKLCGALQSIGVDARLTAAPTSDVDVNHFMIFHYVTPCDPALNTMCVTHVDDAFKISLLKQHIKAGVRAAFCMSSMTARQLAEAGVDTDRLTFILPAHDGRVKPRRIVIGITSNCYEDGRKREWMLERLAREISLSAFEFQIFGRGWEKTAQHLREGGALVTIVEPSQDYGADYERIVESIPKFDYYFYPGLDEGSLGTLDALAAGVPTIITRQGFHLDIPHAITHGFWDYDELKSIFLSVVAERALRIEGGGGLTWEAYARAHAEIWRSLIASDELPDRPELFESAQSRSYPVQGYASIMLNPQRRHGLLKMRFGRAYDFAVLGRSFASRLVRAVWSDRS